MGTDDNIYRSGLERNAANFAALTPINLLEWVAEVYPSRCAVVHGPLRRSWGELAQRSRRLASALRARGVGEGDTVAVMLPNTPPMIEAHYGVPMSGAVLNSINTRLDAATIAFILRSLGLERASWSIASSRAVARQALETLAAQGGRAPLVIDVDDPEYAGAGERGRRDRIRATARAGRPATRPARTRSDEWDAIGLNYTSGTTGNPEGSGRAPSRRLPERDRQRRGLEPAAPPGLPVDAADVPLQRLVLSLDDGGGGRNQRVPAQGRRRTDLRAGARAPRDATTAARRSCTAR